MRKGFLSLSFWVMDFFSFTLILRVEAPVLYKGLLSCDFTTEDILDVTNYLREQVEDDAGKSPEHFIAPSEHSTTAIISVLLSIPSCH